MEEVTNFCRNPDGEPAPWCYTMDPDTRSLVRITLPQEFEQRAGVKELVDQLMGRNPEHRFNFIQNRAGEMDRDMIDA